MALCFEKEKKSKTCVRRLDGTLTRSLLADGSGMLCKGALGPFSPQQPRRDVREDLLLGSLGSRGAGAIAFYFDYQRQLRPLRSARNKLGQSHDDHAGAREPAS